MNIGLYITTARKAKAQAKKQNYKHGRTTINYLIAFNLLKILRSVSLKFEIWNGCAENFLIHLIMDPYWLFSLNGRVWNKKNIEFSL